MTFSMGSSGLDIRPCDIRDLPAVTAIYGLEVEEGTASFETVAPDLAEMTRRYRLLVERSLPFLIAERGGVVVGYAYAGPYRDRHAYRFTVEDAVYVAQEARGTGVGKALLTKVIERAVACGMHRMVAVIGDSANSGSIRLHENLGFRRVGTLDEVGFKFGRFLDTVIMQRNLLV